MGRQVSGDQLQFPLQWRNGRKAVYCKCVPVETQTPDPLLRGQMLCPTELQAGQADVEIGLHTRCRMCPVLCRTLCHNPALLTDPIPYFSARILPQSFGHSEWPEFVGPSSSSNSVSLGFVPSNFAVCVRNEEAGGSNPLSSTIFSRSMSVGNSLPVSHENEGSPVVGLSIVGL
jgi:hypothetical protein